MRIFNKKLLIPAMVVLLLSAAIFSMLTFMFADESNDDDKSIVAAATLTEGKTLIDYIIDNSYNTDDENDNIYHVLEIYTGSAPSKLKDMVNAGAADLVSRKFENLVLNGHKSEQQSQDMNPDKIEYVSLPFNGDNDTLIKAINTADLVYLSEDPAQKWDASNNVDLSEEIKNALSKYATNDEKPLIIDSHTLTQEYEALTAKSIKTLATNYYAKEGSTYSTYRWPSTSPVSTFMNMSDLTDLYMPVRGNTQSAQWAVASYTATLAEGETKPNDLKLAKYLVISADPANGTLTNLVKASFDTSVSYTLPTGYEITADPGDDNGDVTDFITSDTYTLTKGSDLYKFGYSGLGARPDAVRFDYVDVDDATAVDGLTSKDFNQYDFVIIEADAGDLDLSSKTDVYNSLQNAMYSGAQILYDSSLDLGNSTTTVTKVNAPNYEYVFNKVSNLNDTPRYGYVLVTAKAKMDIYYQSRKPKGVKDIADIINAGTFRGIKAGGTGDSSNVYTVLEIQPCYPINMTLAKKLYDIRNYKDPLQKNNNTFLRQGGRGIYIGEKQYYGSSAGFYYIRTDQVSHSTTDEISYGDGYSFTLLLEDLEYYNANAGRNDLTADETTKVNDAKANIDKYFLTTGDNAANDIVNQVANITDYYDWALSRAKIAHATGRSYDQVNVVHMSAVEFATTRKTLLDNFDAIYIGGNNSAIKDTIGDGTNAWYLSSLGGNYYTMYFHNGDAYPIADNTYSESVGDQFDYGLFAGNDLTKAKYDELLSYAQRMPVIIDNDLVTAYKSAVDNVYNQHLLDPESNMYNFLNSIMTYDTANGTVTANNPDLTLVNFDPSYTYKVNNTDNKYGNTYGGFATVFRGDTVVLSEDEYFEDENNTVINSQLADFDAYGVDVTDYNSYKAFADSAQAVVNGSRLGEVLNHRARPLLAVKSTPSVYSEDDKTTWVDPESALYKSKGLVWKVAVSEPADVRVYFDEDGNGRFTADEEMDHKSTDKANGEVTLSFKPSSSFYGVVYWKVEAVSKASKLKVSTTNVCKVKRTTQPKMYVNLLQIMAGRSDQEASGGTNYSKRSLFLCTECQYAKNVLHGNRFTTEGMFFAKVVSGANTFSEAPDMTSRSTNFTSTDGIAGTLAGIEDEYIYPGTMLGYHTHDFGISKYYADLALLGDGDKVGFDDISTNWFTTISDDYDVDTTILYTSEIEEKIADAKAQFAGLTEAQVDDKINSTAGGYTDIYNRYNKDYNAMKDIINGVFTTGDSTSGYSLDSTALESSYPGFVNKLVGYMTSSGQYATDSEARAAIETYATASFKLDDYIKANKTTISTSGKKKYVTEQMLADYLDQLTNTNQDPQIPRDKRKYYDIYNNFNEFSSDRWIDEYTTYFCQWRDAKIFENFFFEMYQKYLLYASYDYDTENVVLSDVYDCVALGAAENFYEDDINDDVTYALSRYIDDQGNLILFHDTLSSKKGVTTNMTNDLASKFGMNARHMYLTYGTLEQNNLIDLSIDGVTLAENVDLSYGIGSRNLTFKQEGTKDNVGTDVSYTIGGTEYKIDNLDNDAKSYEINVTRTKSSVKTIKLYMTTSADQINNYSKDVVIPANASKVYVNFNYETGHAWNWMPDVTVETIETVDDPDSPHTITVINNGNRNMAFALNTKNNIIQNSVAPNSSFDIANLEATNELEICNQWGNGRTSLGYIPANASEITISFTQNDGNLSNINSTVTKTTTDTGLHKVTIKLNGTGTGTDSNNRVNLYVDGNQIASAAALNAEFETENLKSNLSSGSSVVITYTVDSVVKSSDSFAADEYGIQKFIVNFTDGTNIVANETVDYSINGEKGTATSDSNGQAIFSRENYKVSGYVEDASAANSSTVSSNSDQVLTVVILDVNGNPVLGKTVKAVQTSENTNTTTTKNTNIDGVVVYTYKNYYEDTSSAGTITREAGYDKNTYKVTSVKPDGDGKETFNYAPRMLAFKGYFVNLDKGSVSSANTVMMYKYGLYHSKVDETSNISANIGANHLQEEIAACGDNNESMPTDKTKQNNKGIITMYPFGIGESMKVSATAPQSYAVDIEDDDLVVYYTLAGGTQGTSSAAFAADPMDGINNYFLYQYGSITYTGAGHMKITGYGLENNDERRLFINIIVNSGRRSAKGPSVNLYDLGTTTDIIDADASSNTQNANKIIKASSGVGYDYLTEIEDLSDFKGFDFLTNITTSAELKEVQIYYNVNHTADAASTTGVYKYDDTVDKMIFESGRVDSTDLTEAVLENQLKEISTDSTKTKNLEYRIDNDGNLTADPVLALTEDCFDNQSGGQYAYIVVWVKDSNDEEASAILRIQYKPALIDLN